MELIDLLPERYVADALIYTGSMAPVAPLCAMPAGIAEPHLYQHGGDSPPEPDGYTYDKRECVSFETWAVRHDATPTTTPT